MAKVIGLSGPQGGGKSTLLNGLRDLGVPVDDFKVSRQVQIELGLDSLERVYDSPYSMMAFQEKVLNVKAAREADNAAAEDALILTERTFADIASYAQLWSWKLADAGKWDVKDAMDFNISYVRKCARLQQVFHGNLVLPFMPHVAWQADPRRANHADIPFITESLDRFFESKNPATTKVFRITEGSIDGRINQVHNWLKEQL